MVDDPHVKGGAQHHEKLKVDDPLLTGSYQLSYALIIEDTLMNKHDNNNINLRYWRPAQHCI